MFNIGGGEFLFLAFLGLVLVGPDKLPRVAQDSARFLLKLKKFAQNTTNEIKQNLGPGYEDLQVEDLNPKRFVKKHIIDSMAAIEAENEQDKKARIDPDIL